MAQKCSSTPGKGLERQKKPQSLIGHPARFGPDSEATWDLFDLTDNGGRVDFSLFSWGAIAKE